MGDFERTVPPRVGGLGGLNHHVIKQRPILQFCSENLGEILIKKLNNQSRIDEC